MATADEVKQMLQQMTAERETQRKAEDERAQETQAREKQLRSAVLSGRERLLEGRVTLRLEIGALAQQLERGLLAIRPGLSLVGDVDCHDASPEPLSPL